MGFLFVFSLAPAGAPQTQYLRQWRSARQHRGNLEALLYGEASAGCALLLAAARGDAPAISRLCGDDPSLVKSSLALVSGTGRPLPHLLKLAHVCPRHPLPPLGMPMREFK
jgi:hypothetical protein